jgi:hypothetical protein
MAEGGARPIGDQYAQPVAVGQVQVADVTLDVVRLDAFHQADIRRAMSFVTNFGQWTLPTPTAEAMATDIGRLEWIHDTGELLLLGGIPHIGEGSADIPAGDAVAGEVPGFLGGTAVAGRSDAPGAVRIYFPEEQLPADTRVAVLGTLRHGPRVHEVLWGWHQHHREPDGWTWLSERLRQFHDLATEDDRFA